MAGFIPDIRIIDLSHWWAGPFATLELGGMGAEVIKIESVQRVDGYRGGYGAPGERPWEKAPTFNGFNLNKHDVTLDMTRPEGKALFLRLVRVGDVVIENYSARVMDNFGLGYEDLRRENPSIVYVSMPGFGSEGPWRDYTGFAFNLEQLSGIAHHTGYADGPPYNTGAAADPMMGMYATFAVMAALEHRRVTGQGQLVDLAHLEALTAFSGVPVLERQISGTMPTRTGNVDAGAAPHGFYPCRGEDQWVAIAVYDEEQWQRLLKTMGGPEWAGDPRFGDELSRWRNQEALDERIAEWTRGLDKHEAMTLLQEAGVPAGAANDATNLIEDRHLAARGFYQRMDRADVGEHPYPHLPYYVDGKALKWARPAPTLGEHNELVLAEVLGLEPEELRRLAEERIIGTTPLGS